MNTQPITRQHLDIEGTLDINEIFYSIQGEGPWQGYPCVFIRLAGCNLRCTWCDSDYATAFSLQLRDLISLLDDKYPTAKRIVITGGEPFTQNIRPFIAQAINKGYRIQIETNGSIDIPFFPYSLVTLVCSPKSGRFINKEIEHACQDFKYVVGEEDLNSPDGLPTAPTQEKGKNPPPRPKQQKTQGTIWVMPRDDQDYDQNRKNRDAAITIALKHGYRLCLQTHKILGVD